VGQVRVPARRRDGPQAEEAPLAPLPAPVVVEEVRRDLEDVRGVLGQSRGMRAQQAQVGLLQDVVGQRRVAADPPQVAAQARGGRVVERAEACFIQPGLRVRLLRRLPQASGVGLGP
jgi:hypothetical protein